MSWLYRHVLRPALFTQDSERVHDRTLSLLARASRHAPLRHLARAVFGSPELPVQLLGLRFPNPVGLAAGMDKRAAALPIWESLGFGFAELGGVTWHAQPGNPSPRMFRAVADQALINRMGFNNPGAEAFAQSLCYWRDSNRWPRHPIGVNLGKSKITPLEEATEDYAQSFQKLRALADFFVVNVSSPNTPNLRQLQDKHALAQILSALRRLNQPAAPDRSPPKPILIKIAPDLSWEALDDLIELAESENLAGIVATNTTITRPETPHPTCRDVYAESGGLSGRPLRECSTQFIAHLYRQTQGRLPIIGVGGIFSAEDAWEKIQAGASLIQVYTGLVFEGPGLARSIVRGLRQKLAHHGLKSLSEAVGQSAQ